jgi:transposase
MSQNRKKYSKEFKLDVIQQSYHVDNIKELANELGLRPAIIYKWRTAFESDADNAFPGNGVSSPAGEDAERLRLQKENAELRMERDILKKAIGIFGKKNG